MVKKVIIFACFLAFIISIFVFSIVLNVPDDGVRDGLNTNADVDLSAAPIIGTWRRDETRVYVFNEDGTGIRGRPGLRREFIWAIINGEIRTANPNGSYSLLTYYDVVDDTLVWSGIVNQRRTTFTYTFYSVATDLYEEEGWVMVALLTLVGVSVVIVLIRKVVQRNRKNSHNISK